MNVMHNQFLKVFGGRKVLFRAHTVIQNHIYKQNGSETEPGISFVLFKGKQDQSHFDKTTLHHIAWHADGSVGGFMTAGTFDGDSDSLVSCP
jgi:hypothetical protein